MDIGTLVFSLCFGGERILWAEVSDGDALSSAALSKNIDVLSIPGGNFIAVVYLTTM